MYVVFLIYCIFLSYCLQLVSYPYFITDCLFNFSEVELFFLSLLKLVLVWYWHWWQGLWKLYGIKDFNIIKTFLKGKKQYIVIYIVIVIKFFVISWYKILVISPISNDYCNQGKANYSDIQNRALGVRYVRYKWDANEPCMCALDHSNIIFLLEYSSVYSHRWIQWVFYNGCLRVLEKFVRISGVHTGIRQLVLTEELFTDGVVNSE